MHLACSGTLSPLLLWGLCLNLQRPSICKDNILAAHADMLREQVQLLPVQGQTHHSSILSTSAFADVVLRHEMREPWEASLALHPVAGKALVIRFVVRYGRSASTMAAATCGHA